MATNSRKRQYLHGDGSSAKRSRHVDVSRNSYDKPFPFFRRPTVVGSFSLDRNREFVNDRHQLKYYKPFQASRVELDLNEGLGNVIRKDETKTVEERLTRMLQWIQLHKSRFSSGQADKGGTLNTDFVCFRGLLTTLMCTPYENRDGWKIVAMRWRDTVYLCQRDTEEQKQMKANETERQRTMGSWGYKFEQYMMSDGPNQEPKVDEPVIESEEFCCMYRTRLGSSSLVYGAEMDGIISDNEDKESIDLNKAEFVELKTSRLFDNPRQEQNFWRFKARKWWGQSFLVGIKKIVCGFRDDDGIVMKLSDFDVHDIPKQASEFWLPNVCMNFLSYFLNDMVKDIVTENDLSHAVVLEWNPKTDRNRIQVDRVEVAQEETVLPKWYLKAVFNE